MTISEARALLKADLFEHYEEHMDDAPHAAVHLAADLYSDGVNRGIWSAGEHSIYPFTRYIHKNLTELAEYNARANA